LYISFFFEKCNYKQRKNCKREIEMAFLRTAVLFAVVAGFAAAQQLTQAEADALARAEALIASLKPKVDRLARSANVGPSVAAVAGDIVQSVGAGQAAVVKIGGTTASTLTVTEATIDRLAAVTQTIGSASIAVSFSNLFVPPTPPTNQLDHHCQYW
jgi:hypothetical protein